MRRISYDDAKIVAIYCIKVYSIVKSPSAVCTRGVSPFGRATQPTVLLFRVCPDYQRAYFTSLINTQPGHKSFYCPIRLPSVFTNP